MMIKTHTRLFTGLAHFHQGSAKMLVAELPRCWWQQEESLKAILSSYHGSLSGWRVQPCKDAFSSWKFEISVLQCANQVSFLEKCFVTDCSIEEMQLSE